MNISSYIKKISNQNSTQKEDLMLYEGFNKKITTHFYIIT